MSEALQESWSDDLADVGEAEGVAHDDPADPRGDHETKANAVSGQIQFKHLSHPP